MLPYLVSLLLVILGGLAIIMITVGLSRAVRRIAMMRRAYRQLMTGGPVLLHGRSAVLRTALARRGGALVRRCRSRWVFGGHQ